MPKIDVANLGNVLRQPVDGTLLGVFRIVWGLLLCVEVNWLHNQLRDFHDPNVLHFYFQGFSWIRHFPSPILMEIELVVMLFAAFFVAAGIWFRASCITFTVLYAHFFFAEAITYNNHFYLIILIGLLLSFTSAEVRFSVDEKRLLRRGKAIGVIPFWNYVIIRLQVIIVYVYGAVAKLTRDWLIEYEPVRFWLNHTKRPPGFLKEIIVKDWFTPLTVWGGLFIDLICPFMLLWRRTRILGIGVLVLFHAINSQLFNIGYFPLIGIALLIPFFSPKETKSPARWEVDRERQRGFGSRATVTMLTVFFVFQIIFPLRWHLWRPADPLWTEKGQRFSWRMMLREKVHHFELWFPDPEVGRWIKERPWILPSVAPSAHLKLGQNPYFIWQYVQATKKNLEDYGKGDVDIHVMAACSLNGRPYYPLIDPHRNLAEADCPVFSLPDWILPLPELPVDFEQIMPISDREKFARQAIGKWIGANPGVASQWVAAKAP